MFPQSFTLNSLPPLSLYIHIPWCIQKCPYCDFNSHHIRNSIDETAYIQAVLTDLQNELPYFWGRTIETVFIGGGTPSVFSARAIDDLLCGVRALVKLHSEAEITLEANPGTFEREKFCGFRDAGVNRLSIGVQSFDDTSLQALGRIHNGDEAQQAIQTAVSIFDRVNVDLMYALPHQSIHAAIHDVQTAAQLGATHISAYQLTLEPNTAFGHTPPAGLPENDALQDIEDAVHETLAAHGFARYEISAFASHLNQRTRHNLNYWQFGDYIGIGAGAHGKLSYHNKIERTTRIRHPNDYLAAMQHKPSHAIERKIITPSELPLEFMMNALRLTDGVPTAFFSERTGMPLVTIGRAIQAACAKGLLDNNPMFLRATPLGLRFLNNLIELFF